MSIVEYMIFARIDLGFFRLRDFRLIGGDGVNLFNPIFKVECGRFKVIWVYPETHVHNLPFYFVYKNRIKGKQCCFCIF